MQQADAGTRRNVLRGGSRSYLRFFIRAMPANAFPRQFRFPVGPLDLWSGLALRSLTALCSSTEHRRDAVSRGYRVRTADSELIFLWPLLRFGENFTDELEKCGVSWFARHIQSS